MGTAKRYITLKEERQLQPSPEKTSFFSKNFFSIKSEKLMKTICVDEKSQLFG
jgi:hypothetical protein